MSLKQKLVDLLEHAYRQEQIFIQSLSDEERSAASTLQRWSAKDTMAHIAAWKERAAHVLAALRSGEPGPGFDGLDQFNARVFKEHRHLTWSDVLDKSAQAYGFLQVHPGLRTPELGEEMADLGHGQGSGKRLLIA